MKLELIIISILVISISCKTKEEWKSRSIYQILTDRFARTSDTGKCNLSKYCGGNFKGIIQKLDYIKGMGFDAIWISPVIENYPGSYHGYHFTNLYTINPYFGTEADFIALIKACHLKDIWIMIDVVANHVGPVGTDYSKITPFNKAEHYHDVCQITDWNNQKMVENCRLADLPDLKQENDWVTKKLVDWIHDFVAKYKIDGIRIDTIMEVPKWFWDKFRPAAGVFQIGEAFYQKIGYVADYQRHLDSVFNYPLYYIINSAFCNGSFRSLENYWFNQRTTFPAPEYTAVFVENHDNKRFLNVCPNQDKFTNAVVFSLLWEGVPVFYYGGEMYYNGGDDPKNREPLWETGYKKSKLYNILATVHKLRKKYSLWKQPIVQRYAETNFYAFTKGNNVLACFTNQNGVQYTITYHPFKNGDKLCNELDPNDCVTVNNNQFVVKMGALPKLYVKQ